MILTIYCWILDAFQQEHTLPPAEESPKSTNMGEDTVQITSIPVKCSGRRRVSKTDIWGSSSSENSLLVENWN